MKKKLYLWEEGLWHRCHDRKWHAGNYSIRKYECPSCKFTHPYLEILIPFLSRYFMAKPFPDKEWDYINVYYYSHSPVIKMDNFKKERVELK